MESTAVVGGIEAYFQGYVNNNNEEYGYGVWLWDITSDMNGHADYKQMYYGTFKDKKANGFGSWMSIAHGMTKRIDGGFYNGNLYGKRTEYEDDFVRNVETWSDGSLYNTYQNGSHYFI